MMCRWVFTAFLLLLLPHLAAAGTVHFEKQLLPVLKDNCLACHNKTTTKGGLNMETPQLMIQGGESGPALVTGAGEKSLVYLAAAGDWDSDMPPKANKVGAVKLTSGELALLKQWIDEGALQSAREDKVIAWEPLPESYRPILSTALTPDGHLAAAARGNQVTLYHLPTRTALMRLTDPALLKAGLYTQPGVAHRDVVPAMAFSPDGTRLATGSYQEVKLWQKAPATLRPVPPPAPAPETKLRLAAPVGDAVALMDGPSGKSLREIRHGAAITARTLSADTQQLATAGADRRVRLWETATGKPLLEIRTDLTRAQALETQAIAVNRATLAVTWSTETLRKAEKEVTDLAARLTKAKELDTQAQKTLETLKKTQTPAVKPAPPAPAAPSPAVKAASPAPATPPIANKAPMPAEKVPLTAAEEAAVEALRRAEEGCRDTALEIQQVTAAHQKATAAVTAARQALEAAKQTQAEANAAKAAAGREAVKGFEVQVALAFSPAGSRIVGVDAGGTVRVWCAVSGLPLQEVRVTSVGEVQGIVWQEAEAFVVLGSAGAVRVPDEAALPWRLERVLGGGVERPGVTDRVAALAFSPDGRTLAVGSGEPTRSGDVTLWEVTTGRLLKSDAERHVDTVLCLAFSPDGQWLASGGADKLVRVTSVAEGRVARVLEGHTHHVLGLSWRGDGHVIASAGADAVVKVWDAATGERRKQVEGWDKEVTALLFLGGGDALATVAGDGRLRVLSSEGAELRQGPRSASFLNALSASHSGETLIAGGEDGVLWVGAGATGKEQMRFLPEVR